MQACGKNMCHPLYSDVAIYVSTGWLLLRIHATDSSTFCKHSGNACLCVVDTDSNVQWGDMHKQNSCVWTQTCLADDPLHFSKNTQSADTDYNKIVPRPEHLFINAVTLRGC